MIGEKAALRQQFLAQRPTSLERQALSERMCQHLSAFLERNFRVGQTLLAYWPFRQEPDVSELLQWHQYQWGLPRCLVAQQLTWHLWQSGDPLVPNCYGIKEPVETSPIIDPSQVSALILPAVAIDRRGYRLGYGGGYFDRLLSQQSWQQILTIGVVFDAAYVPCLPADDWDRPLHYVCTESGIEATPNA